MIDIHWTTFYDNILVTQVPARNLTSVIFLISSGYFQTNQHSLLITDLLGIYARDDRLNLFIR